MKISVQEIATFLGGEVEGDPAILISGMGRIEDGTEEQISFLSNMKYETYLYTTRCGAVLVNKEFTPREPVRTTLIRVDNAYDSLAKLLELKESASRPKPGISSNTTIEEEVTIDPSAHVSDYVYIAQGATIGAGVVIMPFVYIGEGVTIGDNTLIYSHVTICANCSVGKQCIIHSGAVIGADGFGFAPSEKGYRKIPQIGNVVIEDEVEIGANTCIDRASLGSTVIHKGVKIDNLVQIAHNAEVGEYTVMAAQSGIAGSVRLGKWNLLGGQVGVAGHLNIADKVTLAAQTGVISNVTEQGSVLFGSPAGPIKSAMKAMAIHRKLPQMYKQLNDLQKQMDEVQKALSSLEE